MEYKNIYQKEPREAFILLGSTYVDPFSVVAFHRKDLHNTLVFLHSGHTLTISIPAHEVRDALEKALS